MRVGVFLRGIPLGFSIAAFGLALVASAMTAQQMWLQLIDGIFLCYVGVRGPHGCSGP